MIDFRYHLVSLVSVFLALAVGIVLGAGPLKESLGSTLLDRVESLRQEKDALRAELDTANSAVQHRDQFITTLTPSLISGQLTDRSVAILTLPDVDGDDADALADAITAAGGKVTGRVSIGASWVDPERAEARTQLVTDLATKLPTGTVPAGGETDARLATLLAGALVSTGAGASGQVTEASSAVLEALRSADLIGTKGNVAGLAGGAMVLAPANAVSGGDQVKPTPAADAMSSYVALAAALDLAGGGTVVTGPASSATSGGVLTAVRELREQLAGGSGAYGFGGGVADPLPALVAVAPGTTSTPAATKK
jgi:hypothetical protein